MHDESVVVVISVESDAVASAEVEILDQCGGKSRRMSLAPRSFGENILLIADSPVLCFRFVSSIYAEINEPLID